jgi:hypothetical protein
MKQYVTALAAGGASAMLAVPTHAASVELTGAGTVALSVMDIEDSDAAVFAIPGFGSDAFGLQTLNGAIANVAYDFRRLGHTYVLDVDTFQASGHDLGTSWANLAFNFETTAKTTFEFSVTGGSQSYRLPSDFTAVFNGIRAESYLDIDADYGVGGNIPVHGGAFLATGVLPPGVYSLTIDAFEALYKSTALEGGSRTTLTFTAAHVPLPTAGLMGVLTLATATLAGSLRRPRRR